MKRSVFIVVMGTAVVLAHFFFDPSAVQALDPLPSDVQVNVSINDFIGYVGYQKKDFGVVTDTLAQNHKHRCKWTGRNRIRKVCRFLVQYIAGKTRAARQNIRRRKRQGRPFPPACPLFLECGDSFPDCHAWPFEKN